MNNEAARAQILELITRIAEYASYANLDPSSEPEAEILKNDVREFAKSLPTEDRESLTSIVDPSLAFYSGEVEDFWDEFGKPLRTALIVIDHRLEKGQLVLEATNDEIVIDAGTPHTAYVKLREIVETAKARLRIVDPYVGRDLLSLLSNADAGASVEILTWKSQTPADFCPEAAKFIAEHRVQVEVRWGSEDFHDRFLIADGKLYMSGGSFKDLGKKLSYVTEVRNVKDVLIAELETRWQAGTKT